MNYTNKEQMSIVIAGHVDHGKSTIIGRLMADTDSLPHGKLDQIREFCKKNSRPFEYAFLLDALKDEQAQGITIDSARVFFKTEKRNYIIIDAPGHIEFLKNMVTGASRAEAALLVIDAQEGVKENSRRHGYLISMLGIRQIMVLVNKMDLVDYNKEVFESIQREYSKFLAGIDVKPAGFIPVSGFNGDNIAFTSEKMTWFNSMTVLEALDSFVKEKIKSEKDFRMPVQDVYKFTDFNDTRRIIAGTVESGILKKGDELIFFPSGKKSRVKSIEGFNSENITEVTAGYACGFTLSEQIYITRGEIASKSGEKAPEVSSRMRVNLFWLGKKPLTLDKEYFIKTGSAKISARIEKIIRTIDASTLENSEGKASVEKNAVAECIIRLKKPSAFDTTGSFGGTGRFVIVDDYEIRGGGIIVEALGDRQSNLRDMVFRRNFKWEKSFIAPEERYTRYNQKPHLVLVTGGKDTGKKKLAKQLEENLFNRGKFVYFLGIGNLLYGVDADIKTNGSEEKRSEHIRRLAEVAHLMLDSGMILIVTAVSLSQEELEIIKTVIDPENISVVCVGKETKDINYDFHFLPEGQESDIQFVNVVRESFEQKGIIYKAW